LATHGRTAQIARDRRSWHHARVPKSPEDAATEPAKGKAPSARRRSLLVMIGDRVEARPLPLAGDVSVGRGHGCDVQIDHPSMSRTHLVLRLGPRSLEVLDGGGVNGTWLRGVRLPEGAAVEIAPDEVLVAGDVALAIQEVRAAPGGRVASPRPSGAVAGAGRAPIVLDRAMRQVHEIAARVARGTISVLLLGETGVGKEVLAEVIHQRSPRAGAPLIRINCAALTDSLVESELFGHERGAFTGAARERTGLLEAADGGTVLLDEVGELPAATQAKLLRVVEERAVVRVGGTTPKPIDVRFVSATNRDLEAEIAAGRFRRDLYFRLAGVVLNIPPLRDRPNEVVALAEAFAAEAAARLDEPPPLLGTEAVAALRAHAWPGNLRELRNVLERAVLLADGGRIDRLDLGPGAAAATTAAAAATATTAAAATTAATAAAPTTAATAAAPLAGELTALERQRILNALAQCNGNQTRAAALLGMPRRTFVNRLETYGIPRPRRG